MLIRQAQLKDTTSLSEFNQNMALETEGIELIPEVITEGVKSMINNPHRGFYLVAEEEGKIQASLMVTTEWSDWRNGLFWWIQSVYVKPDYRRQGLYRQLYARVKSLAEAETDVCGFRLYVEQENTRAQETYKALGMEETHYKIFEELTSVTIFSRG